ncbi:hypothetical protein IAT38_001322 [Cryptococcus sp. DSM 104549]
MSGNPAGPSTVSKGTLLDLKAITAEHVDRFAKEGRAPVKGQPRRQHLKQSKDPFDKPSPGLIKRLAREARNDAKARRFVDEDGPTEEERREILKAKAIKYEQMKRGDLSGLSEKEIKEAVIDFERKLEEDDDSDESSDEDESARPARARWSDNEDNNEDDLEEVEYVDEMGRTRTGTRKEAREAEHLKRKEEGAPLIDSNADNSAYAEVLKSNVIHGEQYAFPVYQPDPETIKAKIRAAEEEARAHHYDASKEVRIKAAGQYQFSLDEAQRAEQMASLKAERAETERKRAETVQRNGLSAAQEAKKRKVEERRAVIEAKRLKLLGGEEAVAKLRKEKEEAAAEAFLKGLEGEMGDAGGSGKW